MTRTTTNTAKHLLIGGFAIAVLGFGASAFAQSYVGAKRCGSCHPFAYQKWLKGPHAKAHGLLNSAQLKDAKCNTCHTTVLNEQAARAGRVLDGVQCEHCHGRGQYYHSIYVMKDKELARAVGLVDPDKAICARCHTEGAPTIEKFDFAKFWARIDHGKAAREAAEASGTAPEAKASP